MVMSDAKRIKKMEREIKELENELKSIRKKMWTATSFQQCVLLCKKNRASFRVKKLKKQAKHLKKRVAQAKKEKKTGEK